MGYVFCAMTIPLCKLQTFKVKTLQFVTHCFLRQEKFEAAEVAGKFSIHVACSKLCLKMHKQLQRPTKTLVQQFTSSARNSSSGSIIGTPALDNSTQEANFKIERENCMGYKLCVSKFLLFVNPFAISASWVTD